jgi:replication factor C large subunit
MAAAYDMDAAAVSFVTGSGESTNKVESIVADAQELREAEMEENAGSAFEGARAVPDDVADDGDDDSSADTVETGETAETDDAATEENEDDAGDDSQMSFSDFG